MAASKNGEIIGGEKFRSEQTLICLLHACKGHSTTIELRDETSIHGLISHVDGYMNIKVAEATMTKIDGLVQHFEELFVQGNKIRFVHIPDEIDMKKAIFEQLKNFEKTKNRPRTADRRGRGRGRARGPR